MNHQSLFNLDLSQRIEYADLNFPDFNPCFSCQLIGNSSVNIDMDIQTIQFETLAQTTFLLRRAENPRARLIILNHGFMSNAERMWDRFIDRLPDDVHLLAANGPYPIPTKLEKSWKVGYSWFFYDNFKETFFIGYDIPKAFAKNLCQKLGFEENLKTIIGFSQGGYAAPHMAEGLNNVDHVIGMGCRFKIRNPKWPDNLIIEAIHGEDDDVVEWAGAQESFQSLPEKHRGQLMVLPKLDHKPNQEMLGQVASWVKNRHHSV